ncbi:alpha/beta fold hydrolase [Streptacidiphilus sp. EB129]|uniref:alpha/beta fold hydrolase n=1 Tax=Streptacidiphilus sp. EB129 TaxID=3156262 RepID=UPI003516B3FA
MHAKATQHAKTTRPARTTVTPGSRGARATRATGGGSAAGHPVSTGSVTSADGTRIAFDLRGDGPPVILVDGALCHRAFGPATPLAQRLAADFTVLSYDRRGRGGSGDEPPYAADREIEDLNALVAHLGGSASVYGNSSGAALALEAARQGAPIRALALYEAPFLVDDGHPRVTDETLARLDRLVAADRRGDAVTLFLRTVGTPGFAIAVMRLLPVWRKLKAVAHTLPYDIGLIAADHQGRPFAAGRWDSVTMPVLVAAGGKSPEWMRTAMRAVAEALPNARLLTVEGQTHMLNPDAIAPVLTEFFRPERPEGA